MGSAFLAVDWGTTNLRAWLVGEDGRSRAHQEFPLGVGRLGPGEAAQRFHDEVRPAMGAQALPALMCGMIGSNLGWAPVPYLDCPAGLGDLRRALHPVAPDVRIVPGLRGVRPDGGPDVMRGEETHVVGWAADAPERLKGQWLICHPGTHAKWVRLVDGRIEQFVTSMTGELFGVLSKHSVLKQPVSEEDPEAFDQGLAAAGDGGALASRLFTARARVVGGDLAPERAQAYLSGVLIGAEAAGVPPLLGARPGAAVAVIGDLTLAARYERALKARGFEVSVHDGEEAVLSGLKALNDGVV